MDNTLARLTRIAARYAKRFGVSAAVYANGTAFDVLTERRGMVAWLNFATVDAHRAPRATALDVRRHIKRTWGG